MAICGLVITLGDDPGQRAEALRRLGSEPGIELGQLPGTSGDTRVPAVLEATGKRNFLARWHRIAALAGVAHLDLVYVHYEDADDNTDRITDEEEQGQDR